MESIKYDEGAPVNERKHALGQSMGLTVLGKKLPGSCTMNINVDREVLRCFTGDRGK